MEPVPRNLPFDGAPLARGFTLIELLVVTAIIIIITGVIFAGQSNFSNTVILTSTAYDVALTMRDAETYGLGTRAAQGASSGVITNAGYGLDFQIPTSPRSYTFFADSAPLAGSPSPPACHPLPSSEQNLGTSPPNAYPGDCVYDAPGAPDVVVSNDQLGNGVYISNICASATGTSWECNTPNGQVTQLDIIFLRPNAQPFISINGAYNFESPMTSACIALTSGPNSRYITLAASGEITASDTGCPPSP